MNVRVSTVRIPPRVATLIPSLGRENEHEIVATVRAIDTALKADGFDFHDLAKAIESIGQTAAPHGGVPTYRDHAFGDVARACRDLDRGRLSSRERAFIADMVRRGFAFRPSPRQAQWLAGILDRLQARKAAA